MNTVLQRFSRAVVVLAGFLYSHTLLNAQEVAGTLDPTFDVGIGVNGLSVNSIAVQPDGKIILAGSFGAVNGQSRNCIARLLPNGNVESLATFNAGSGANSTIRSVALQADGKIVIGGDFTFVNSQPRNRIARLLPNGTLEDVTKFNPGSGADGIVHSVVVQGNGKILLGGEFATINGETRNRIARLNADGTLENTATFDIGTGINGFVNSLALQPDGKILVGGGFGLVNGQPRTCFARLNANGSVESTATFNVGAGVNQPVLSIAVQADGKIIIGGPFTAVNNQPRSSIARLHADGILESNNSFKSGSGVQGIVRCIKVQSDGKILIGGGFNTVNGLPRSCFARLLSDGSLENTTTFNSGLGANNLVMCAAIQSDDKILLGGQFATVNGQSRNRIARLTNAIVHGTPVHELVWSFQQPPKNPGFGSLIPGPGGYYWGTTEAGGAAGKGTIFKVKGDGSDWQTVISFTGKGGSYRGAEPLSGLCSDGAGNFWGVTYDGGAFKEGTIYKVNATSGEFTTVVDFTRDGPTNRGARPYGGLVRDEAGFLWGTTSEGGTIGYGTIFKVSIASGALTTLVDFSNDGLVNKGGVPRTGLTNDGAGFFWGTTLMGANASGTVYKVNQNTGILTTVHIFDGTIGQPLSELTDDGVGHLWGATGTMLFKVNIQTGSLSNVRMLESYNASRLVLDGEGYLWGTLPSGGIDYNGSVYKVDIDTGEISTIRTFTAADAARDGTIPIAGLISDGAGSYLGTTSRGGPTGEGTVFKLNAITGVLTTLATFTDELTTRKGNFPYAGLVSDGAGFLWGSTQHGGKGNGTIFKLEEVTGELTTVLEFTDKGEENRGAEPRAMLSKDGAGYFWGSTSEGGGGNAGTVFKLNISTGEMVTVHEFDISEPTNLGARPNAELVTDDNGFLWGTAFYGGTYYSGTIFKVNMASGELVKVSEIFPTTGYGPYAALTADGAGHFWGTTNRGGDRGSGLVFKIEASTGEMTTVTQFTGLESPRQGTEPRSKLLNDGAGYFWGITSEGGLPGRVRGLGTIYKIHAETGVMTSVIQFTGTDGSNKGSEPRAQLISDNRGNFWGTTWRGGVDDEGTVFKLNGATGELTTVLEFSGFGDQPHTGSLPGYGSLLLHSDGNIYGTTQDGGPDGGGTIFRLRFGPTPVTLTADSVANTTATLHGTINPNGYETTVSFEISTNASLAGAATFQSGVSGAGSEPIPYNQVVTGLLPSKVYYYRIVGSNAANGIPQRGPIRSFTTLPNQVPVVTLMGVNPVTLEAGPGGYADAGASATDSEDGALVPQMISNTVAAHVPGTYLVTWSATDSSNQTASAVRTVNVIDSTAPSITPPANVNADTLNPSGSVVHYPAAVASDAVGVTQIQYSHPSGITFPRGSTNVTVTAFDAAGNQGTATFSVNVTLTETAHQILWQQGSVVPGAGVDARIPEGAQWTSFGAPAISPTGKTAFVGKWKTEQPRSSGEGLFLDDELLANVGDSSPADGALYREFKDPVFAQDSETLLVPARLSGPGVKDKNDTVLLSLAPAAAILAREGDETGLGANVRIARFISASAAAGRVVILADLAGGGSAINRALLTTQPGGLVSLVRTRQTLFGKTIKSLHALQSIPGSPGHGRGELSEAGIRYIARFTDGTQAIAETSAPHLHTSLVNSGEIISPSPRGESWKDFGIAVNSTADGAQYSFLARMKSLGGSAQVAPAKGIFLGSDIGFEEFVRVGDPVPTGAEGSFSALQEPVLASDGTCLAFLAKTALGRKSSTGIFAFRADDPLATVTTLDTPPAGTTQGTRWKSFDSLAIPGGGVGPIFTATLRRDAVVNGTNDQGLWAVDTAGTLRCLVREGDTVEGKSVKSIQVLEVTTGTPGVARAFNTHTQIVWRVTFTDRKNAIILSTVP